MVNDYTETLVQKRDPWHAWQHVFAMRKQGLKRKAKDLTLNKFENHFENLLSKKRTVPPGEPPPGFNLPPPPWGDGAPPIVKSGPVTLEEIKAAARSQSNHKSNGPDHVAVEVLKLESVQLALVPIFNAALVDELKIPPDFFDAFLIALHKKGDVEDTNNYRGISLMSHVAKLFHLVLMKRVREALDKWISPTQNAYRPSRSCHHHTVAATALHQAALNHPGYPLHMLFIDFSKAFDSVDRVAIERILKWWNIPDNLVKVLMRMLTEHKLFIRHEGQVSESPVQPTFGILQGDTIAPLIFCLVMDYIFLHLDQKCGARIENWEMPNPYRSNKKVLKTLTHLAYADDVVLLANSEHDIQRQFNIFQECASHLGMTINLGVGKTEEMRVNVPDDVPLTTTLAGKTVAVVDSYKYLGCMLGQSWELDFARRKKLAWGVIAEYSRVWKSDASFDARKGLFVALVEPILLYGGFTYPNLQVVDETLHRCHSRMLRHCVGLGRPDPRKQTHLPTEYLYYGNDVKRGKTWKTATLTLPAALARQKSAALGHWTRDHFLRDRRHPVIDVLRFDPSKRYCQKRSACRTVRDSFEELVPQREGHSKLTLIDNVLVPENSMTTNRHDWYDECKYHVFKKEREVMQRIFERRLEDPSRSYGDSEYKESMKYLGNREHYTQRWLTRKTRNEPLGEDRDLPWF